MLATRATGQPSACWQRATKLRPKKHIRWSLHSACLLWLWLWRLVCAPSMSVDEPALVGGAGRGVQRTQQNITNIAVSARRLRASAGAANANRSVCRRAFASDAAEAIPWGKKFDLACGGARSICFCSIHTRATSHARALRVLDAWVLSYAPHGLLSAHQARALLPG